MGYLAWLLTATLASLYVTALPTNLDKYFDITWGGGRGQFLDNGRLLTLTLDKTSGSGFQSKSLFLFGKIDVQIRLVPGNSAGTVTAFFMKAPGSTWDEIDFEFLGNLTGDPYTVHTNVYGSGIGGREQQFRLWFDPTTDFHTYSILWNPHLIAFYIDGVPIRQFRNIENRGVPFPMRNPMRLYSSIWNADEWATRGGQVKTDWSQAPFRASYRNFVASACEWVKMKSYCSPSKQWWFMQQLDKQSLQKLNWIKDNHMIYNYCTDRVRFPRAFPTECYVN